MIVSLSGCSAEAPKKTVYPKAPKKIEWMDAAAAADTSQWGTLYSHDPSILKAGDTYYVYSTDVGSAGGVGIQIKKSKDLVNWSFVGHALPEIPQEAVDWASPSNLWAPDILKVGGEYRLYYAASSFGSQRSAIMLATSAKPEGPFQDKGIVLKTDTGDPCNAIDPDIVTDQSGNQFMVYGSFWGGIYILPISKETGKPGASGFGTNIARRSAGAEGAVEGPFIRYNPDTGYYYLFVSYGSLSSDYNVRVGRSKSVTGPYLDYSGHEMTDIDDDADSVGYKLTTGYQFSTGQAWMALGHNSVLDDNGAWYFVCHARPLNQPDWPYLQVRRMVWSSDGWPLVSPELYAGETLQAVNGANIAGKFERIDFQDDTQNLAEKSSLMELNKDNTFTAADGKGTWKVAGENTVALTYRDGSTETYTAIPSWDWENWSTTIALTGKSGKGICSWAKRVK